MRWGVCQRIMIRHEDLLEPAQDLMEPAQRIMIRHADSWPFKEGGSVGAGAVCLNQAALHPDQCF